MDGWTERGIGSVQLMNEKQKENTKTKKKGAGQMKRKEKRAKIISNEQRRVKLKS